MVLLLNQWYISTTQVLVFRLQYFL
jgi:hypothetical protein